MKRLCVHLLGFPLLWNVCSCTSEIRFTSQIMLNASSVYKRGRQLSFLPSTQPSISLPAKPDLQHRRSEVHSELMSSYEALHSERMGRLWILCLITAVVLVFTFLFYWLHSFTTEEQIATMVDMVEKCDGPWAKAFREAAGEHREAMQLLFCCNIVTLEDAENPNVQSDDIKNLCSVAVDMLGQKSLNDWLLAPAVTRRCFEQQFKLTFPGSAQEVERVRKAALEAEQSATPARAAGQPEAPTLSLVLPAMGHPWSPPSLPTESSVTQSVASVTDATWQSSSSAASDRSLSPGGTSRASLRFFEGSFPSNEHEGPARNLPLHLLGPTPSIFKNSVRGSDSRGKKSGRGSERKAKEPESSSSRAMPSAVRSHAQNQPTPLPEVFQQQQSNLPSRSTGEDGEPAKNEQLRSSRDVPILDCSPRAKAPPAIQTDIPPGHVQVISPEGRQLLTATPVGSDAQVRPHISHSGSADPAG